jgi:hypothetical protein
MVPASLAAPAHLVTVTGLLELVGANGLLPQASPTAECALNEHRRSRGGCHAEDHRCTAGLA